MNKRIIVFGVSGSGKTTIGKLLAKKLKLPFLDADDFHSDENIQKMAGGIPLTDLDRLPWLKSLNKSLLEQPNGFVLACSALKEDYRKILSENIQDIDWILLTGEFDLIYERILNREDHYFPAELLQNQFKTIEIPEYGKFINCFLSPNEIIEGILFQKKINKLNNA